MLPKKKYHLYTKFLMQATLLLASIGFLFFHRFSPVPLSIVSFSPKSSMTQLCQFKQTGESRRQNFILIFVIKGKGAGKKEHQYKYTSTIMPLFKYSVELYFTYIAATTIGLIIINIPMEIDLWSFGEVYLYLFAVKLQI